MDPATIRGMRLIPLTQGKFAMVDDEDYDRLMERRWYAWKRWGGKKYDAVTSVRNGAKRSPKGMGRIILGDVPGLQVDHINGNPLDNRRCNIRLVTLQQNMWNKGKTPNPRATSKYIGVTRTSKNRWTANIMVDGKVRCLGSFPTEEEAARARDAETLRLRGPEFARLNFPAREVA